MRFLRTTTIARLRIAHCRQSGCLRDCVESRAFVPQRYEGAYEISESNSAGVILLRSPRAAQFGQVWLTISSRFRLNASTHFSTVVPSLDRLGIMRSWN